jgi:hypothetical protein
MKLKLPMLNEALRTEVIDGKVYVDLEQLVQLIFDVANESTIVATRTHDPGLGVLALGVSHLGQALDGLLETQKEAAGLRPDGEQCSRLESHRAHPFLKNRKKQWCSGVAEQV